MKPIVYTQRDLVRLLQAMAEAVRAGDSFEGNVTYTCMDPQITEPGLFLVTAAYRVGNSEGQGGMVIIGELEYGEVP